jgi:hypothetical protein
MRRSGCGNLWLARGSHRRRVAELKVAQRAHRQPEGAVELRLPAGAAVLWRTAVWHCVGPQTSQQTRKVIHIGYHHRWLRPTDYTEQDAALLARCSPVRRQLLGALPLVRTPAIPAHTCTIILYIIVCGMCAGHSSRPVGAGRAKGGDQAGRRSAWSHQTICRKYL